MEIGVLGIGCLNIHGTRVTANNSTNNNVVFFFVSDLKILLILFHNAFDKREKIFYITIYLETKSFKTVSKLIQPINTIMIYYWDKKLKKGLHVLKADIITFDKNIDLMSLAQRMHFYRMCSKLLPLHLSQ